MKNSKLVDEIKRLSASFSETQEKLKKAEAGRENGEPDKDRLAKVDADISFLNQQIRYTKEQISAASEKLLKRAAKNYDGTIEQGLRADLIAQAGLALSTLKSVLSVLKEGGAARELDFLQLLPAEIKAQAAARNAEAAEVVQAYLDELEKNKIAGTIADNPQSVEHWQKRLFGQVMRNDFELIERLGER